MIIPVVCHPHNKYDIHQTLQTIKINGVGHQLGGLLPQKIKEFSWDALTGVPHPTITR